MRSALIEAMAGFITAAFAFVAALAWNNAIVAIFAEVFGDSNGITELLTYAIIVTIIAVLATYWVGKALQHAKEMEAKTDKSVRKAS